MRLAIAVLLLAAPAFAAVPETGEGTITLLGGIRTIFPSNQDYLVEQGGSHKQIQPGGLASFGYQYDEQLHFKIELGYMVDHYRLPGGDLSVKTIPLLLGMDTALWRAPRMTLYGGGGIGYYNEANSTAGFLGLGLRVRLTASLALVIEDRYTLASAQVDAANSTKSLNVGGNFFSVGLMFHYLQPEEKGYTPPVH